MGLGGWRKPESPEKTCKNTCEKLHTRNSTTSWKLNLTLSTAPSCHLKLYSLALIIGSVGRTGIWILAANHTTLTFTPGVLWGKIALQKTTVIYIGALLLLNSTPQVIEGSSLRISMGWLNYRFAGCFSNVWQPCTLEVVMTWLIMPLSLERVIVRLFLTDPSFFLTGDYFPVSVTHTDFRYWDSELRLKRWFRGL